MFEQWIAQDPADADGGPLEFVVDPDDLRSNPLRTDTPRVPHVDVIVAWNNLEFAMRQISSHYDGPAERGTTLEELINWMRGAGMADAREADAIRSLWAVRNRVAHGLDQRIDGMDVADYKDRADTLIGVLARRVPTVPLGSA